MAPFSGPRIRSRSFGLGKALLLIALMAAAVVLRGAPGHGALQAESGADMIERILPAAGLVPVKDCDHDKAPGVTL